MERPLIETFQNDFELQRMVQAVENLYGRYPYGAPASILEIGCWDGGTLWEWMRMADRVVAVDDRMRRLSDWNHWARDLDADFHPLWGMSHEEIVIEEAKRLGPYDFLFIDADHTYPSVLADWNNYSPMVRDGGLVAFHDIFARPGYGVSKLWEELTSVEGCRYMEIRHNEVQASNEGLCGIGLIYL